MEHVAQLFGLLRRKLPGGGDGGPNHSRLAVDERLVFLRSSHEEGVIFGVRTPRFKLMARERQGWGGGWFRLYDLAADPGELRDVAAERRLLQAALALRLERWLEGAESPSGTPAAISQEDLEMLRSLGYLE